MKIHPVEPSYSMRTDGQTSTTELIVVLRYFSSAPKRYKPFLVFTNRTICVPHSVSHTHTHTHTHTRARAHIHTGVHTYTQTRCDLWDVLKNVFTGIL